METKNYSNSELQKSNQFLHPFNQAERIFSEVRRIESYRVEGMEIYSTTLWHLQKDVALSALSKDLTDMDKNSPEVSLSE